MQTKEQRFKLFSWLVILVVIAISVIFINVMRRNSRMETNLDEYMPKQHPAFLYSDQAEEWFNIKDGILIAIENQGGIYNTQTLQKIKDITIQLQDMDEFDDNDVISLYTADNITGSDDGLEVRAFYTIVPDDKERLDDLKKSIRTNDMVYRRLVSMDETVGLIVAGMNDEPFTPEFYKKILSFAKSFESDSDKIYVAGRPIVEGTMALLGPADMKKMVPIVLVVIALVLYLLLGSVRASSATLISVFVSSIYAFGLMALLKIPIYSVSTMIPVMLIAIGVAYGIYFYNHLEQYFAKNPGTNRSDAVLHVLKILWKPLAMAAFTTMIGFASLLTSQVYPIKYFGVFTAFGIFMAFVLALLFLPATVMVTGYRPKQQKTKFKNIQLPVLLRITDKLLAYKKLVIITTILIVLLSIIGIQRVWINSSFLDNFEKNSEIVKTDAFVNSKFGGTSTLNVVLESKESDVFKHPENLRLIDRMQKQTQQLAKVGNSFSLADYLKRMNMVMNADDPDFYTIPETSDHVAQYLLLYEMSGDPENLTRVINYDYSQTNITFQLKGDDSKTIKEALNEIEKFKGDFWKQGITVNYAGSGYKALVFTGLILEGQIKSILISLLMVLVLLTLMFRSLKAGLIGSAPIIITAFISFGVMGLFNIPLNTATALLSSIAIGIGIDYAIHFIENYRGNLAKSGDKLQALYDTMIQKGKAILFNAVVVISGFLVLLFSVFPPNRTLGALVSMNMFTSLLGTLSIMMVLIFTMNVFVKRNKATKR
ncbi:MAG: efflux RND transporter permease subunit [Bacteroidales bacterium]|nr:efflux RND transporter permease subunit [Bacteroidales bacterium]